MSDEKVERIRALLDDIKELANSLPPKRKQEVLEQLLQTAMMVVHQLKYAEEPARASRPKPHKPPTVNMRMLRKRPKPQQRKDKQGEVEPSGKTDADKSNQADDDPLAAIKPVPPVKPLRTAATKLANAKM